MAMVKHPRENLKVHFMVIRKCLVCNLDLFANFREEP